MKRRMKKIAAIAAPILFAGVLYLGGTGSMGTVLAKTVTTVIRTQVAHITKTQPYTVGPTTNDTVTNLYTTGETVTEDGVTETDLTISREVKDRVVEQTTPREAPAPACAHSFQWVEEQAATATSDEVQVERCSLCGAIRGRQVSAGSAVSRFQEDMTEDIENAQPGTTAVIHTETWTCLGQKVLDELAARGDVSLELHYKYEGVYYTLTIPAGADLESIRREDGFYGFRYLDSIFGGHEEIK